jgi:hypothetical protein
MFPRPCCLPSLCHLLHPTYCFSCHSFNFLAGYAIPADPGDVALEDEAGLRYWLGPNGERLSEDPNSASYAWVEHYSADMERPYYYNQVRCWLLIDG